MRTFHIGFDDTDSTDGMCTTFLCYTAVKLLLKRRSTDEFLDYPNLIRLNPNIPWKTRGNASLVLRLVSSLKAEDLFDFFTSLLEKYATSPRANSGLILFEGGVVPLEVQDFSKRALYSVLGLRETRQLVERYRMLSHGLRSQQGLVGALAGIGNLLVADHTYELICYREDLSLPRRLPLPRVVHLESLPGTFSSYDHGRVMISPHGPDPVLCGIRGEKPEDVKRAFSSLLPLENLQGYMIFRSNQGTGEHLSQTISLSNSKSYYSGTVIGAVASRPRSELGGHVFFNLQNSEGEISCACYEPTAEFRERALQLVPGDVIEVGGGVRKATSLHPKVLNLEFLKPIKLVPKIRSSNPICPKCNDRMTSRGKDQGFGCVKCGSEARHASKIETSEPRNLIPGLLYIPPVRAHRHLTKPVQRFSREKKKTRFPLKLIAGWIS
jgi:tRNA(Ile2)-agmatinylcytidine synthase